MAEYKLIVQIALAQNYLYYLHLILFAENLTISTTSEGAEGTEDPCLMSTPALTVDQTAGFGNFVFL